MKNEINENAYKDKVKNIYGGFSKYKVGTGTRFERSVFRINPNEAKVLNIQPGEYSSGELANSIIARTPYLGSTVLQKLYDQKTDDDMLEILTGDIKSGEGLGFKKQY